MKKLLFFLIFTAMIFPVLHPYTPNYKTQVIKDIPEGNCPCACRDKIRLHHTRYESFTYSDGTCTCTYGYKELIDDETIPVINYIMVNADNLKKLDLSAYNDSNKMSGETSVIDGINSRGTMLALGSTWGIDKDILTRYVCNNICAEKGDKWYWAGGTKRLNVQESNDVHTFTPACVCKFDDYFEHMTGLEGCNEDKFPTAHVDLVNSYNKQKVRNYYSEVTPPK